MIRKRVFSFLFASFALLITFSFSAYGQCVRCVPAPPGWMCMGATIGGEGCITEGLTCTLVGTCTPGDGLAGSEAKCETKTLKNPLIDVSSAMIRQVAAVDPRLAMALASVREIRADFKLGTMSFVPVDITISDVENRLKNRGVNYFKSNEFKELKRKAAAVIADGRPPIVYDITVGDSSQGPVLILTNAETKSVAIQVVLAKGERRSDRESFFTARSWTLG